MVKIVAFVMFIVFIFIFIEQCSRIGESDECRWFRENNSTMYAMKQQWGDC